MKTKIQTLLIFFLLLPNLVLAQAPPDSGGTPVQPDEIQNPLRGAGIENIGQLITWIINLLLALIGIVAILSIMISGYKMVIGSGNADEVKEAKQRIIWSLAGVVVVILAYTLVRVTINALSAGP